MMKLCPSPFISVSSVIFPGHHFDSLTDNFIRCSHHTSPSDCPFSLLDTTTTAVSLHDVHVFSLNSFPRVRFFTENGFVQHTSLFKGFIAEIGFPQASALFHENCVSSVDVQQLRQVSAMIVPAHIVVIMEQPCCAHKGCCRRVRLIRHVGGPFNVVLRSFASS